MALIQHDKPVTNQPSVHCMNLGSTPLDASKILAQYAFFF